MWPLVLFIVCPGTLPDMLPPASDIRRFPGRGVCCDQMNEGRQFRTWVVDQASAFPHRQPWYDDVLQQADRLYNAWDILDDAWLNCEKGIGNDWKGGVRACLSRLRDVLGDEYYYRGWMPPAVPWWHFPERD